MGFQIAVSTCEVSVNITFESFRAIHFKCQSFVHCVFQVPHDPLDSNLVRELRVIASIGHIDGSRTGCPDVSKTSGSSAGQSLIGSGNPTSGAGHLGP